MAMELPPMSELQARQFLLSTYRSKRLTQGLPDWETHDVDVLIRPLTRYELYLIQEINQATGN